MSKCGEFSGKRTERGKGMDQGVHFKVNGEITLSFLKFLYIFSQIIIKSVSCVVDYLEDRKEDKDGAVFVEFLLINLLGILCFHF